VRVVTSTTPGPTPGSTDRLYFRQLLSGRDFAVGDPLATQMVNFVYAIGDRSRGECVLVDPAYAVADLLDAVEADGMTVTGVLASHYHPDHIGGSMMGYTIEGVPALLQRADVPVHVQAAEAPWVARTIGVAEHELAAHQPGDSIAVGDISIELLHTPGHTPGSQCLLVDGRLVSGDTLFLEGCGRTDLPGSDAAAMYDSLQRLAALPEGTVIYPGHRYSIPSSATMSSIREQNYVFKPSSKQQWLSMFG
jgi:glyoxylase-like metal-dependent hydrolase (beta-lactamase superfamily II)